MRNDKWTKCTYENPEHSGWYLIVVPSHFDDSFVTMGYYRMPNDMWELDRCARAEANGEPTHWQPLPELPDGL